MVPKRASIRAAVHGIFGYALMSCATVRDGIEVGTRFFDLTFAFSRAALEYAGDEVRFCLDDRHVPAQLRGFLLERDVPGILAHWGALWGQPSEIRRIEVAESLGERIAPVFRDRGFLVKTTASTHAVVVDARALDRPMPTTSPEAAAVLLRECAELLQRRQNHGELGARVREVLLRRAAELGSSVRTLRRQLGEEGASYRAIVAETLGDDGGGAAGCGPAGGEGDAPSGLRRCVELLGGVPAVDRPDAGWARMGETLGLRRLRDRFESSWRYSE